MVNQPDYASWLTWVNENAWDDWVLMNLPGLEASRLGLDTAGIAVRFTTDLQADLLPVHRLWWWRVRVQAEWVPSPESLVSVPIGPWVIADIGDQPQSWPAPSRVFDFTSLPLDPAITFTRASTATYVDGAGLVHGAAVNEPRIDHHPVSLSTMGLLVEGNTTNYYLQSGSLLAANWLKAGTTSAASATLAPDGVTAAVAFTEDTTTGGHYVSQSLPAGAFTVGQPCTVSGYVHAGSGVRFPQIVLTSAAFGATLAASFDLATGATATVGACTASIRQFGAGWWRVAITATPTASASIAPQFRASTALNTFAPSYAGDGTSSLLWWGAQCETAGAMSSYIPTTTATAVRSPDVASVTGANFSSWFNPVEGAVGADWSAQTAATTYVWSISDGSSSNALYARAQTPTKSDAASFVAGVTTAAIEIDVGRTPYSLVTSTFAYKANDFNQLANGILGARDLAGAVPAGLNRLSIGAINGASQLGGRIKALRYYPVRVPLEGDTGTPPDWIIAGTPPTPSLDTFTGGTPLKPSAYA